MKTIQQMVQWWRKQGPPNRTPTTDDDSLSPGVDAILVRAPSTGIPALTVNLTGTGTGSGEGLADDTPGSAVCTGYTFTFLPPDPTVRPVSLIQERVWNFSETAVSANAWVLAIQERGGRWIALTPGPQSATAGSGLDGACGDLAALRKSDCVLVSSNDDAQDFTLSYQSDIARWTTANIQTGTAGTTGEAFTYPTLASPAGSGVIEFWVEDGRPRLTIDSRELIYCGEGVFSGGPATGHPLDDSLGTGTGDYTACSGVSFSVTVSCVACVETPVDTGTGTGTGTGETGTGGGTIAVTCRPELMPNTLTLTILTSDECCVPAATELTLTYSALTDSWDATTTCGAGTVTFSLYCPSTGTSIADWELRTTTAGIVGAGGPFTTFIEPGSTSSPLSLLFNIINAGISSAACSVTGTWTCSVVE